MSAKTAIKKDTGSSEMGTLKFEEAMERLELVVTKMESGELDLDAVISEYEKGIHLAKVCHDKLEQAKTKVAKLNKLGSALDLKPLDLDLGEDSALGDDQ